MNITQLRSLSSLGRFADTKPASRRSRRLRNSGPPTNNRGWNRAYLAGLAGKGYSVKVRREKHEAEIIAA